MYAGTTIRRGSGRLIGTHQKIDRVARRRLQPYIPRGFHFPKAKEILRFEGLNGPDGVKKKSPARDEPWHYIDPTNPDDRQILDLIRGHENNLIAALREKNNERAAFEAAWLAHAIVDGLTPAHHYPLEEKLIELRNGQPIETRTTFRKKNIMPGDTMRERFANNWEYWGAKGVMTTHGFFEFGVAFSTKAVTFRDVRLTTRDRAAVRGNGIVPLYLDLVNQVYSWHMYDKFQKTGWTNTLALRVKNDLMPLIIHAVLMSWYSCLWRASHEEKS